MLKLLYKGKTSVPVEVPGLTPCALREKSLAEIEKLEIFHGNQRLPLAELFTVAGHPGDAILHLEGDLSGVHWIGAGMSTGEVHVHGNAGRHVGSEMTGGQIQIHGDASDWVGGELRGGMIHVHGHAGNLIGSAYRGSKRGTTGGTILIDGNVGDEIGHSMRRGLLAVGGDCGDFAGVNMIAGTILVFGDCGSRAGAGMRRGTLGLFGRSAPKILCTFRKSCLYEPLFLQLIFRSLRARQFSVAEELLRASYRLYHGDLLSGGRGELLVCEARESSGASWQTSDQTARLPGSERPSTVGIEELL